MWGEDICGSFVLGVLWLTTRQKRTVARGRDQETVAWLLWEITKSNPSVLKTTTCELYLKTPFRQNDLVVREENKLSTEECESCASSSAASRTKKKKTIIVIIIIIIIITVRRIHQRISWLRCQPVKSQISKSQRPFVDHIRQNG